MAVEEAKFYHNNSPMVATIHKFAPGAAFKLYGIELHLGGTPTTSENFVITKDDGDGSPYDTVELKQDLSSGSITDFVHNFIGSKYTYKATDVITFAWTNTQRVAWGLKVKYELV